MAEEAMQKIKILGLETTATSQDLVAGFQQLIGPAAAAGLTMQQTLDFTMSMVQSLGAIGIPLTSFSAEARIPSGRHDYPNAGQARYDPRYHWRDG